MRVYRSFRDDEPSRRQMLTAELALKFAKMADSEFARYVKGLPDSQYEAAHRLRNRALRLHAH
jgi:hypothetical protein